MFNESVGIVFNILKMKYVDMEYYFSQIKTNREKTFYFYIDFNYLLNKYLYEIDYHSNEKKLDDGCVREFLVELLNLIAHYKQFFYTRCDALSFFYIGIQIQSYSKKSPIDNLINKIVEIVSMIPKIYIYWYHNKDENLFFKYNLTRHITITKNTNCLPIFIDMSNGYNNELFYIINKNYNLLKIDLHKSYLYGYNDFVNDYLTDVEPEHINSVISMMPVYEILNSIKINKKVRIDDVILKYIKNHEDDDFNKLETQLMVIKLFTRNGTLTNRLIKLYNNLNSEIYTMLLKITINEWKHTIKDNKVYCINELYNIPNKKRINVDALMKY